MTFSTTFVAVMLSSLWAAVPSPAASPSARVATGDDLTGMAPGDDRLPPPTNATPPGPTDPIAAAEAKVIYINMDGAELTQGGDDSIANVSAICGGSFPAYGDGPKREATLQAVHADWAAYNVSITTERPAEGNFTMAVVSNVPQSTCGVNGPAIYGVAPMDCGDQRNNIVFAFHSEDDDESALLHATVISQEIAHSYGLDHTNNPPLG